MKSIFLLALFIIVFPHLICAQGDFIGLYANDEHSVSCVTGVGFYSVEMWIWCLPVQYEHLCAEFAIQYPSNVIASTVTGNTALISVTIGDLQTGISVCYVGCQSYWYWLFHQSLWVINDTPTWIEIITHPDPYIECVQFAPCVYAHCAPG